MMPVTHLLVILLAKSAYSSDQQNYHQTRLISEFIYELLLSNGESCGAESCGAESCGAESCGTESCGE